MSNDHFIAYAHSLWPDIVSRLGHDPTDFIAQLLKIRDTKGSERVVLGLIGDRAQLIFKCRSEGANPKGLEVEVEATKRAHAAMAGAGRFKVPKILASSVDDGWLVQSLEPGISAKKILAMSQDDTSADREMQSEILTVAGGWLAGFHQAGTPQATQVQTATMRDHAQGVLMSVLAKEIDETCAAIFRDLGEVISNRAHAAEGETVRSGPVHGDFVPQNLLVHKDQITGLDLSAVHAGPNAHDQAKFLSRLYWDCTPDQVSLADVVSNVEALEAGYGRPIAKDAAFSYLMPIQVLLDLAHPKTTGQRRDNLFALAKILISTA